MGWHLHHAIVVTSFDEVRTRKAHAEATRLFEDRVSQVVGPLTNGYASFFVAPDGSKEGWPESDELDLKRKAFRDWLRAEPELYVDWVEVAFGGDEGETLTGIVDHDDALSKDPEIAAERERENAP